MIRNSPEDFAQRLYARLPGHYRVYDAERGHPLLALMRVVGEQVAGVRQDLDALWDNFFIETCDDWVVPYIGALVGANLLQQPVGQSNRLDVWNTVLWRRSKGTPQMLQSLSNAVSGWPTSQAEFFLSFGWAQNLNHVRLDRPLTPDLRNAAQLALLGQAADPFSHAADFTPARSLNSSPSAAWGTPGRYQIDKLGVFVQRLKTFPVQGGMPAAVAPGGDPPAKASCLTFNPLFRNTSLFRRSGGAISRASFNAAPWAHFGEGADIAVRQFGVMLASSGSPSVRPTSSNSPFSFGSATSISIAEMRLLEPRSFQLGSAHFLISAVWQTGSSSSKIGFLSTLLAASNNDSAFRPGSTGFGNGQLVITIQTGQNGIGWPGPPLPASPAARFPGAVLAIRGAQEGSVHTSDGLYVYLPPGLVLPADVLTYFVADDGSTYTSPGLETSSLARASEGQVYPPCASDPSTAPALTFRNLNRRPGAMVLTDPQRFGNDDVLVEAALFSGPSKFQTLGGIATIDQAPGVDPELQVPNPWPAYSFAPSANALTGKIPEQGMLSILLRTLTGSFIPPAELVITNRGGQSLLVYLPEIPDAPKQGVRVLVADDGSTWFVPADSAVQQAVLQQQSLNGLSLARAAQGQALGIPGRWPILQRIPVALNLCRVERASLLAVGELGIDPELGRFALPPDDPALSLLPQGLALDRKNLSVDYVEAFPDLVGAMPASQREIDPVPVTRYVSRSGDVASLTADALAGAPVHSSLAEAVAAAQDGDLIEITDSSTYEAPTGISVPGSVSSLTIRAATGQRPCLTSYVSEGTASAAGFIVSAPMSLLSLSGLLLSGGPFAIRSAIARLQLSTCTIDPSVPSIPAIVTTDSDLNSNSEYIFHRTICGGLWLSQGVGQLTIADSIVDQQGGVAIGGAPTASSPPAAPSTSARSVQLERVTVFGAVLCDVLNASETLLNDVVSVDDQQSGCIRFSRFEIGSVLPRRYRCIPTQAQTSAHSTAENRAAPLFNSRRFGRPDYGQLAVACSDAILTGAENQGEIGAFASTQNTIRLRNLSIKLHEFMPVGLSPVIIAEN